MMKDVFYYNVYTFVHSNGLLGEKKRMEGERVGWPPSLCSSDLHSF